MNVNLDVCITENKKRGSKETFFVFLLTNLSTYCLIVHLGNCLYSLPARIIQGTGIRGGWQKAVLRIDSKRKKEEVSEF